MPTIRTVAIIGAGSSGLSAARHLLDVGFEIKIFEKYEEAGLEWTRRSGTHTDLDTPPSEAAFIPIARGRLGSRSFIEGEPSRETERDDGSLISSASITLDDFPLPQYTPTFISRTAVSEYIRSYSEDYGLTSLTQYGTRVELVEKVIGGEREAWRVRLRQVEDVEGRMVETIWDEFFDAVIVATGNQHAPFIPSISGLSQLPTIIHSSSYTPPLNVYSDIAILIVGSGQSALETATRLSPSVRKIWISARTIIGPEPHQALKRLQRFVLPSNAEVVRPIEEFQGDGIVRLDDGRLLRGINDVIFATGYQYSFPFLPQLHSDSYSFNSSPKQIKPAMLVNDGTSVHHLHQNTFYIPDPTLALMSIPPTSTSVTADIQADAISRVWSRCAALPSQDDMWEEYQLIAERGPRWLNHIEEKIFVEKIKSWLDTHAIIAGVKGIGEMTIRSEKEKAEEVFVGRYRLTKGQFGQIWDETTSEKGSAREEMANKVRTAMMRRNGA